MPVRTSPVAIGGSQRRFCSSVPTRAIIREESECEPMIPAIPIQALLISSNTIDMLTVSRPSPPYSSGTVIPKRPISFILSTIGVG
jgi:hypothetical protein